MFALCSDTVIFRPSSASPAWYMRQVSVGVSPHQCKSCMAFGCQTLQMACNIFYNKAWDTQRDALISQLLSSGLMGAKSGSFRRTSSSTARYRLCAWMLHVTSLPRTMSTGVSNITSSHVCLQDITGESAASHAQLLQVVGA